LKVDELLSDEEIPQKTGFTYKSSNIKSARSQKNNKTLVEEFKEEDP